MKRKTRKLSIKTKILLISSLLIIALILLLGISFYKGMEENMVRMGVEQAEIAAKMALKQIDGNKIAGLEPGDEESEEYQQMLTALRDMKETCNVKFLYTLSTDGEKLYYGIDTDESEGQYAIGEIFEDSYEELKPVLEGTEYVQEYIDSTEDGELITAYMPIRNEDNQVVAVLGSDYDASGIVEKQNAVQMQVITIGAVGLLAVFLILNLVVGRIMKSLRLVNEKIYELVHNEGDLTQKLEVRTGDEMELMADNVNELLKYIREIMIHISKNSYSLNDSTKVVLGDINSAGENIVDVSAAMQEMSAAMEETTASMNQINESVADAHERIRQMFQRAAEGNEAAKEIQEKAWKIYEQAGQEQQNTRILAERMAASVNEKIEKSKSVEEINLLTENIIGITEETNLLALNASIEAARAGEAGKGFAVVANEIGNLASNSAETAVKIQQVSREVILAVEELAAEAEQMLEFMEKTAMEGYQSLLAASEDYRSDAEEFHEVMKEFAEHSGQLEQFMNKIKEVIQTVSIATEESTKGIVSVSEMSMALSRNVGSIEKKADMNKQIAEQLESEVNKFKLE